MADSNKSTPPRLGPEETKERFEKVLERIYLAMGEQLTDFVNDPRQPEAGAQSIRKAAKTARDPHHEFYKDLDQVEKLILRYLLKEPARSKDDVENIADEGVDDYIRGLVDTDKLTGTNKIVALASMQYLQEFVKNTGNYPKDTWQGLARRVVTERADAIKAHESNVKIYEAVQELRAAHAAQQNPAAHEVNQPPLGIHVEDTPISVKSGDPKPKKTAAVDVADATDQDEEDKQIDAKKESFAWLLPAVVGAGIAGAVVVPPVLAYKYRDQISDGIDYLRGEKSAAVATENPDPDAVRPPPVFQKKAMQPAPRPVQSIPPAEPTPRPQQEPVAVSAPEEAVPADAQKTLDEKLEARGKEMMVWIRKSINQSKDPTGLSKADRDELELYRQDLIRHINNNYLELFRRNGQTISPLDPGDTDKKSANEKKSAQVMYLIPQDIYDILQQLEKDKIAGTRQELTPEEYRKIGASQIVPIAQSDQGTVVLSAPESGELTITTLNYNFAKETEDKQGIDKKPILSRVQGDYKGYRTAFEDKNHTRMVLAHTGKSPMLSPNAVFARVISSDDHESDIAEAELNIPRRETDPPLESKKILANMRPGTPLFINEHIDISHMEPIWDDGTHINKTVYAAGILQHAQWLMEGDVRLTQKAINAVAPETVLKQIAPGDNNKGKLVDKGFLGVGIFTPFIGVKGQAGNVPGVHVENRIAPGIIDLMFSKINPGQPTETNTLEIFVVDKDGNEIAHEQKTPQGGAAPLKPIQTAFQLLLRDPEKAGLDIPAQTMTGYMRALESIDYLFLQQHAEFDAGGENMLKVLKPSFTHGANAPEELAMVPLPARADPLRVETYHVARGPQKIGLVQDIENIPSVTVGDYVISYSTHFGKDLDNVNVDADPLAFDRAMNDIELTAKNAGLEIKNRVMTENRAGRISVPAFWAPINDMFTTPPPAQRRGR